MKKKDSNKQDVDEYNEFLKERDDSDDFEQEVIEFGDNVENANCPHPNISTFFFG